MPDLKKLITLEALQAALPSWLKSSSKPSYTADDISDTNTTNKFVTSTEKNTWNSKQSALTTTQMNAVNSGINSTKVGQISTNQANIWSVQNDGAKNLVYITAKDGTYMGVPCTCTNTTFTVGEGTILSGTSQNKLISNSVTLSAGTYYLCGCPSGGGTESYRLDLRTDPSSPLTNVYDYGEGVVFTLTQERTVNVYVRFVQGYSISTPLEFKPMLCKYLGDQTYQPFALSNSDLTQLESEDRAALAEVVDSGAKNKCILDKTYIVNNNAGGTWSGDSYTVSGVTFAFNFTNGTIACSGTASAAIFLVLNNDIANYKGKEMAISGCPSGGNYNTGYSLYVVDTTETSILRDIGSGATFKVPNNVKRLKIGVRSGVNMNSKTFYPMLCTLADWKVSQKVVPYNYPIKCVYAQHKSVACSTTLATTGLNFVATEDGFYRVTVVAIQNSAMPTGISIKQKNSASATQYTLTNKENAKPYTAISDVATYNVYAGGGFELFVSYETATNNQVSMIVEKIG